MRPGFLRLILLLAVLVAVAGWALLRRSPSRSLTATSGRLSAEAERQLDQAARSYLALEAREQSADAQFWGSELDAELHEDEVNRLWDALNATSNAWPVLKAVPLGRIQLPLLHPAEMLPHGIQRFRGAAAPGGSVLGPPDWLRLLERWESEGWSLGRTQWRLIRHSPATATAQAKSVVSVTLPLQRVRSGDSERAWLTATAMVEWKAPTAGSIPMPEFLRVETAELLNRRGPSGFTPWLEAVIPSGLREFMDPLVVADFDGDGFLEPAMIGANRVWWNRPGTGGRREFVSETFAQLPPDPVVAAGRADVDGDGAADLVVASQRGLEYLRGTPEGRPMGTLQRGWAAPEPLKHPQAMAIGDVDGDGDLDVWICQYKIPYQGGQFPTPFHDARDGFPATLLLNDGHGGFVDGTEAAGLGALRHRRAYSTSFIDLNHDGHLDLVQVSDFAGLDVWLNDGHGHFRCVSEEWGAARQGFGMAHVIADLNGDGRPDLLMLGMDSPVAERMEAGGWNRSDFPGPGRFRSAMTFGNRLFFGAADAPGLVPAPEAMGRALARTGWSWGAAFADFDNDRRLDLVVAAGHETRPSTRDYDRQFWRHDLYVAGSTNDPAAELYFRTATGRRRADGASYGGWQQSQLRLNLGDADFPEVAWLLGVAVPEDCRNLVAEDLDGDGRMDLILTTSAGWPARKQQLLVFHNELERGANAHWIGFQLDGHGRSPVGARVELTDTAGQQTRWILAGDSFRSQSSGRAHFGLGSARPLEARIVWPNGTVTRLANPAADTWHAVEPAP